MKTYWNGEGRFQKEYEELLEEVDKGNFTFNKTELNVFYKYYRYYNDGDQVYGTLLMSYLKVTIYLEAQANIAIAKAYSRFKNGNVELSIKGYSRNKLQGIKSFYGLN